MLFSSKSKNCKCKTVRFLAKTKRDEEFLFTTQKGGMSFGTPPPDNYHFR